MMKSKDQVEDFLKKVISEESKIPSDSISRDQSFFELGLDSISSIFLLEQIEIKFNISLKPLDFWDYPNIDTFSSHILTLLPDE